MIARRLQQPGPPRPDRVSTATTVQVRRVLAWLPGEQTLQDGVAALFASHGARHGAFELLGGGLSSALYMTSVPNPGGVQVATYGPQTVVNLARLVRATGSYGPDLAGLPMMHVHAILAEPDGRAHAGHLVPDACVAGPAGLRALLTIGVGFAQIADAETAFSLLFPVSEALRQ
ncbi:MAG: DUF296 domain-containing protein [Acetobacteraceae bacterium]